LNPNNVGSFIALTVFHNGKLCGMLFAEQLGFARNWDSFEIQFLKSLSEIISYVKSVNEKVSFEAELVYLNNHLSQLVQTRTEELSKKQELLEIKNDEILSSLRYAKHIQSAILPHKDYFERLFPESFVFYQPKDLVAGDFYWAESMVLPSKFGDNEVALVAACDCTGHGVPGAMMSMLASSALSRALHQYSLNDPGDILYQVNQILRENMNKSKNEIFDGMDTSLCSITYTNLEKTEVKVKFSGANSPLWIFRNNHLLGYDHQIIKGSKMSVGINQANALFDVHEITLKKGDLIYMFSDGFADQFGGPLGKKLKYPRMRDMLLEIIHLPLSIQRRCIESAFENWKGDNEQIDDVLLIGIKL
jgi:serine phosphatase RsbU (regulator of sigma subunit)